MKNPDYRPIYYCDFLTPDGVPMASYQPVKFVAQPSHFVTVEGKGFKKTWESGYPANRVIYVEVSSRVLTNEVSFDGRN